MDELKTTLSYYSDKLANLWAQPPLAEALAIAGEHLSGVAQRFLTASKESRSPLSASAYFEPYLENPVATLRDRGIELFNFNTQPLRKKQEFIDELLEQLERENEKATNRPKSYEALEHDLALWHTADHHRPHGYDSPMEATYFVITVDFRFLAFDRYRTGRGGHPQIPVCLHPSNLVQLLQFWVPSSTEQESATTDALLPLLRPTFDNEAEETTLKILSVVSRYELDNISPQTIAQILLNKALRQRMSQERDVNEQICVVEAAFLEELEESQAAQAKAIRERGETESRLQETESRLQETERKMSEFPSYEEAREAGLELARASNARWIFCLTMLVCLVGLPLVAVGVESRYGPVWGVWPPTSMPTAIALSLLVGLWCADRVGSGLEALAGWRPYLTVQYLRRKSWALVGLVATAVVAELIMRQ